MRLFTDNDGNFNWAAVAGVCAVAGSGLAIATFFSPGTGKDVAQQNIETVIGDYVMVAGDKIEGITIEEYEAGLARREEQIVALLEDTTINGQDAKEMRETLARIDARQANLMSSYNDVEVLTAEIRTYHGNISDRDLVKSAILDIFDGDSFNAAGKALSAGIPIQQIRTIEATTSIFQPVQTEADFLKFVVGKDWALSDNVNYVRKYGRDGSINGYSFGRRSGTGAWAFIGGKYSEEFTHRGEHYPQYQPKVSVSRSAVKFLHTNGDVHMYSIN